MVVTKIAFFPGKVSHGISVGPHGVCHNRCFAYCSRARTIENRFGAKARKFGVR